MKKHDKMFWGVLGLWTVGVGLVLYAFSLHVPAYVETYNDPLAESLCEDNGGLKSEIHNDHFLLYVACRNGTYIRLEKTPEMRNN